jgi:hypothetical protein
MTETCPKCGAEICTKSELVAKFKCGTLVETLHYVEPFVYDGRDCLRRQIADLKEELASESRWAKEYKEKAEELEKRLDAWRAYGLQARRVLGDVFEDESERLRDLGEI